MMRHRQALEATARAMVAEGKGVLAADESNATMTKRLAATGVESTAETRRRFRELLFAAPAAADYIKVDTGAKPLAGADGETVTEGLDGLRERLASIAGLGRASRSGEL